jgi:N-acetylmuramoyl-L-alanine amidase/Bacterial Ig domain
MGSRRGHLAVAAVLFATALGTSAASGAGFQVLIGHTPNKTETNRTRRTIDAIVIHDTEGRFIGSVRALQNARRDASAHFVVSRRGQIVQLVPVTDVAWHSGNRRWNLHSIGIEHEGWADRPGSYTRAEYQASAKLVAYLAHRWGIPLDRRHIIGHAEVPDPFHRGRYGGASHHTDPGPNWDWAYYMRLVHWYASHPARPRFLHRMTLLDSHVPARPSQRSRPAVRRPVVERDATVRGRALWWSGIDASRRYRKHIWKVDFLVDGKVEYTDHTWPFAFHRPYWWDSTRFSNGRHMLSVRAYGRHGYRAWRRIPIRVANPPLRVGVTGAVAGSAVAGVVQLTARPSEPVERVVLYVDGRAISRDSAAPYSLSWDTGGEREGGHRIVVYARDRHGHRAALELPVVVAASPEFPAVLRSDWVMQHVVVPQVDS